MATTSQLLMFSTTDILQSSSYNQAVVILTIDPTHESHQELTGYSLKELSVLLNEVGNNAGFIEKSVPFLDIDDTKLKQISLGAPYFEPGKHYLIKLRYLLQNNDTGTFKHGETNTVSIFIKSIPATPSNILSTIRAEDSGISLNISSLYTRFSASDGYDPIHTIRYYISKVGGTNPTDLIHGEIAVNEYNTWHTIASLSNGHLYEIAYRVVNNMGESSLSETVTISPSDLPAQIAHIRAVNNFTDITNPVTSANSSFVKVYWSKPSDYDTLKGAETPVPVTSYTIKKQELVWNHANAAYDASGSPTVHILPHDAFGVTLDSYSLDSPIADTDNSGRVYDHAYTFELPESAHGKVFRYSVFATNSNGDGPESGFSDPVASYVSPDPQPFEISHQTEIVNTVGVPVTKHTGKIDLVISSLSQLNGMRDKFTESETPVFESDGITPFKARTVLLRFHVEDNNGFSYEDDIDFTEQYTTETKTFTTGGNSVPKLVATRLNQWRYNDVTNWFPVVKGVSYKYSLKRIGYSPLSPLDLDTRLESGATHISRTYFESPEPVSHVQAYAVTDDYIPVTTDGTTPGIRVLFEQLMLADMNGTDAFISETNKLQYEIRSNSQQIAGISRIDHDDSQTTREFIVPSNLGVANNLYIRVHIINPELNLSIEGSESSPAVSERARDYPVAVTNLEVRVKEAGDAIDVSWNRQSTAGLRGFSSSEVFNVVYLFNDSDTSQSFTEREVPHSNHNNQIQGVTFTGLTLGSVYKIYVVSVGKYTKQDLDNNTTKFLNSVIRRNFLASAVNAVGRPGVPTNVEVYPGADKVTFNYDPVADGELNGHNVNNFSYHFILNSDTNHFPYQEATRQTLQASVANVSGSDEAVISKGYTNVLLSNDRANAVDLASDTTYKYAMYVVSVVGDDLIHNTSDNLTELNATVITLTSVSKTPLKTITGDIFDGQEVLYINNNVPTPEVTATAGEETITLTIRKPSPAPSELVVVLDNNDALDSANNPIPVFSTIKVRDALTASSGLFALENAPNKDDIGNVDYGPNNYDFKTTTSAGQTTYSLTIRRLVNGRLHNVQVRFGNTTNGQTYFGETTVLIIAAEAPPTAPRNPTFTVDNRIVNLSWTAPANSGGAGLSGNSGLSYEVTVSKGNNQLVKIESLDTFLTLNSSNFADITNGETYSVGILAFYTKSGNRVSSTLSTIDAIRPNAAPLSPSVVVTRQSNSLKVDITTVSLTQSQLYPLFKIQIFSKLSTASDYPVVAAIEFSDTNVINSGASALSHTITNLLNGQSYDVRIVCVPAYTYAQAPSAVLRANQIPFGVPQVLASAARPVNGNNKAIDLDVLLNGSGDITQIIALGKSANSSVIGILNLSSATLPVITRSGTQSLEVAGLQTATFRLDFGSTIPAALSDAIIIVNTVNGSDAGAYPGSASGYFSSGL